MLQEADIVQDWINEGIEKGIEKGSLFLERPLPLTPSRKERGEC